MDILTVDFVNQELRKTPLGGWGETYWIKDGAIRHTLLKYTSDQANIVAEFTQSLISDEQKAEAIQE